MDDTIPELSESFDVILTGVQPSDIVPGVTETSAASIHPDRRSNNITIYDNDYPYGLLQFWEMIPENISDIHYPITPIVQAVRVSCK